MLTDEEQRDIDNELERVPNRRAACIGALAAVQRRRDGWVSDDALADIASYLDMSVDELDGVATFYNLIFRRPVGRHVILVCDSVSCWVEGFDNIAAHLKKRLGIDLGETTADGSFTLLPVPCIGLCDHAPAMIVDRTTHGDLTSEKINRIIAELEGE